jgi:AcrR family transcriptional regulator
MTRVEAKAATRERLLAAASEVFAERGVTGAAVEQIAERAGYSRGAFYGNFAGKEDLVAALLAERTKAEFDEVRELDGEAALRDWHRRRGEHAQEWLALRLALLAYAGQERGAVRDQLKERELFARGALAGGLERMFAEHGVEPPAPVEQLAMIVHALEDGLLIQRSLDPEGSTDHVVMDAVGLLCRAWIAQAGGAR